MFSHQVLSIVQLSAISGRMHQQNYCAELVHFKWGKSEGQVQMLRHPHEGKQVLLVLTEKEE